jgi:hypothetical protein
VPAEMPTTKATECVEAVKKGSAARRRSSHGATLLDALRSAAAVLSWPISRRAVRAGGDEDRREFPGDELLPRSKGEWTNAITIRVRPSDIWPWLVQMGCRRAGWYSYDGLDNGGVPSLARVVPELEHVEVGDLFPWTPNAYDGFVVKAVERERALVIGGDAGSLYTVTWAFVLEALDDSHTRLLARAPTTSAPGWDSYCASSAIRSTSRCSDGTC